MTCFLSSYQCLLFNIGLRAADHVPDFNQGTIRFGIVSPLKPQRMSEVSQTIGTSRTRSAGWRNDPNNPEIDTSGYSALKLASAYANLSSSEKHPQIIGRAQSRGAFVVQLLYGEVNLDLVVSVSGATGEEDQFVAATILLFLEQVIGENRELSSCLKKLSTEYPDIFERAREFLHDKFPA